MFGIFTKGGPKVAGLENCFSVPDHQAAVQVEEPTDPRPGYGEGRKSF